VKRKAAGKTIEVPEAKQEESNVVDLMDALKQSLGRRKPAKAAKRSKIDGARSKAKGGMNPTHAIAVMEARSVDEIPDGPQWQYEPNWNGFRCILTRDSDEVGLTSKSGENLKRYFTEIVAGALGLKAKRFVLDGEIVVPVENQFSFDDLLQRIHPAVSRIKKLAEETPALYLAFDLLENGRTEVAAKRLSERRRHLADFAGRLFLKKKPRSRSRRGPFDVAADTCAAARRRPQPPHCRSLGFHSARR
jgi:ATP-dependent DNA ligase